MLVEHPTGEAFGAPELLPDMNHARPRRAGLGGFAGADLRFPTLLSAGLSIGIQPRPQIGAWLPFQKATPTSVTVSAGSGVPILTPSEG